MTWQFTDTSEDALKRSLAVFAAWEPPAGQEFIGFYGNADGSGGVAIIEADSHETIARAAAPFLPWLTFAATPIVPIEQGGGGRRRGDRVPRLGELASAPGTGAGE